MVDGHCYVYMWKGAGSSGNPLTIFINGIVNELMHMYAISDVLLLSKGGITMSDGTDLPLDLIVDNIAMVFYGDDCGLTIEERLANMGLDTISLTSSFKRVLNITMTDEVKSGVMVPYKHLDDCQFLSRSLVVRVLNGVMRVDAPLKDSSLFEPLYWRKRGVPLTNLKLVMQRTLYELSLRGEEEYSIKAPALIKVCFDSLGLYPDHTSFSVCYREVKKLKYEFAF
jgi:hypothetical protein